MTGITAQESLFHLAAVHWEAWFLTLCESIGRHAMKVVIDWVWNGPWWTPLVGAVYLAVFFSIALSPILGVSRSRGGK